MLRRLLVTVFWLGVLSTSVGATPREKFNRTSPDGRFDAAFDWDAVPSFKIVEKTTGRSVLAIDETTGNRGLQVLWAPNSKTIAVLAEWRLHDQMHICRLVGDRFVDTKGPEPPEDRLTLLSWENNGKLEVKGEKKIHWLFVTPGRAIPFIARSYSRRSYS